MKTILSLLAITICVCTHTVSGADFWSEGNVLAMHLDVIAVPSNDIQRARIKLTVTNTSTNTIVLDRNLDAGFGFRFKTDLSEKHTHSDDKDVSLTEGKQTKKPEVAEAKLRFVRLTPKSSISRVFDLSRPTKGIIEGHATDMDMVHHGFFYEAMVSYVVPTNATSISVDAWYERGVHWASVHEFTEWFGVDPSDLGLWEGRARSNTLTIEKQ